VVQDPESFAKGKALFQSGLLSEAVMALEAEVQRHPDNVEAWRLLGTVHAENDDDQQVWRHASLARPNWAASCMRPTSNMCWCSYAQLEGERSLGHHSRSIALSAREKLGGRVDSHPMTPVQAIAALNKALAADPHNVEVLLSLGVSYTNELDQGRAIRFLTAWLAEQPEFSKVCCMQCPVAGLLRLHELCSLITLFLAVFVL
jgi:peroxin-5